MNRSHRKKSYASFVALVRKKNEAKELRDFRPISLVRSFYKILSKLLLERLKRIIGKLVSPHQLAFIKGRQITDVPVIANKCVDSRHKRRKPGILCK